MSLIPKSHPRAKSLFIREKLVSGFDNGLVAKEGLLAQGRGEAFDYLLGPKEVVRLSKQTSSKIEVNLFYSNEKRKNAIFKELKKNGAREILGKNSATRATLSGIDSARRIVDKNGIFAADVVIVPLEDGDRTMALRKAGKIVITFDLNPLSRTSQTANITIVDNVTRAMELLIKNCKILSKKNKKTLETILKNFNNKKNLSDNINEIKNNLTKRSRIA